MYLIILAKQALNASPVMGRKAELRWNPEFCNSLLLERAESPGTGCAFVLSSCEFPFICHFWRLSPCVGHPSFYLQEGALCDPWAWRQRSVPCNDSFLGVPKQLIYQCLSVESNICLEKHFHHEGGQTPEQEPREVVGFPSLGIFNT